MKHYWMVDLGTGNTRVALADGAGRILDLRTFVNAYERDVAYEDACCFRPEQWAEGILAACRDLRRAHPEVSVDAVSAAGSRQSFVLLDREGRAFYGLPNIDNRGRAFLDRVPEPEDTYRCSGKWVTEDFGAAKLLGLRLGRPELYERAAAVTSISEWIGQLFTGRTVMEYSQASETQLYDIAAKTWSPELCRRYGVDPGLLPPLAPAGTVLGPVLPERRAALGLEEETVFILGGADTQAALEQIRLKPGETAVVSGTTSPVVTALEQPLYDPEQRIWLDAGLGGRGLLAETNPGVTGLNYQRLKEQLCPERSYADLERAYEEKRDFACTASFSSLLFHRRRSLRRGGFFTAAPAAAEWDRTDLLWAALADIACSIQEQLEHLESLTGSRGGPLYGCGGGFQSPALCRMLADLSGRELVLKPGYDQATVRGLASLCGGLEEAQPEAVLRFRPRTGQLIHRYAPLWRENRDRANGL